MIHAITKKKFLALMITILVGQLVAFLAKLWIDFPNGYMIMLVGSLVGFVFSYKELPRTQD